MSTIVTGDDATIYVTLKKDGQAFALPETATVQAAIVSADHNALLAGPVSVTSAAPGSNWSRSLVVIKFTEAMTAAITAYRPALVEIEVNDDGKQSWFVDVLVVKGNIT